MVRGPDSDMVLPPLEDDLSKQLAEMVTPRGQDPPSRSGGKVGDEDDGTSTSRLLRYCRSSNLGLRRLVAQFDSSPWMWARDTSPLNLADIQTTLPPTPDSIRRQRDAVCLPPQSGESHQKSSPPPAPTANHAVIQRRIAPPPASAGLLSDSGSPPPSDAEVPRRPTRTDDASHVVVERRRTEPLPCAMPSCVSDSESAGTPEKGSSSLPRSSGHAEFSEGTLSDLSAFRTGPSIEELRHQMRETRRKLFGKANSEEVQQLTPRKKGKQLLSDSGRPPGTGESGSGSEMRKRTGRSTPASGDSEFASADFCNNSSVELTYSSSSATMQSTAPRSNAPFQEAPQRNRTHAADLRTPTRRTVPTISPSTAEDASLCSFSISPSPDEGGGLRLEEPSNTGCSSSSASSGISMIAEVAQWRRLCRRRFLSQGAVRQSAKSGDEGTDSSSRSSGPSSQHWIERDSETSVSRKSDYQSSSDRTGGSCSFITPSCDSSLKHGSAVHSSDGISISTLSSNVTDALPSDKSRMTSPLGLSAEFGSRHSTPIQPPPQPKEEWRPGLQQLASQCSCFTPVPYQRIETEARRFQSSAESTDRRNLDPILESQTEDIGSPLIARADLPQDTNEVSMWSFAKRSDAEPPQHEDSPRAPTGDTDLPSESPDIAPRASPPPTTSTAVQAHLSDPPATVPVMEGSPIVPPPNAIPAPPRPTPSLSSPPAVRPPSMAIVTEARRSSVDARTIRNFRQRSRSVGPRSSSQPPPRLTHSWTGQASLTHVHSRRFDAWQVPTSDVDSDPEISDLGATLSKTSDDSQRHDATSASVNLVSIWNQLNTKLVQLGYSAQGVPVIDHDVAQAYSVDEPPPAGRDGAKQKEDPLMPLKLETQLANLDTIRVVKLWEQALTEVASLRSQWGRLCHFEDSRARLFAQADQLRSENKQLHARVESLERLLDQNHDVHSALWKADVQLHEAQADRARLKRALTEERQRKRVLAVQKRKAEAQVSALRSQLVKSSERDHRIRERAREQIAAFMKQARASGMRKKGATFGTQRQRTLTETGGHKGGVVVSTLSALDDRSAEDSTTAATTGCVSPLANTPSHTIYMFALEYEKSMEDLREQKRRLEAELRTTKGATSDSVDKGLGESLQTSLEGTQTTTASDGPHAPPFNHPPPLEVHCAVGTESIFAEQLRVMQQHYERELCAMRAEMATLERRLTAGHETQGKAAAKQGAGVPRAAVNDEQLSTPIQCLTYTAEEMHSRQREEPKGEVEVFCEALATTKGPPSIVLTTQQLMARDRRLHRAGLTDKLRKLTSDQQLKLVRDCCVRLDTADPVKAPEVLDSLCCAASELPLLKKVVARLAEVAGVRQDRLGDLEAVVRSWRTLILKLPPPANADRLRRAACRFLSGLVQLHRQSSTADESQVTIIALSPIVTALNEFRVLAAGTPLESHQQQITESTSACNLEVLDDVCLARGLDLALQHVTGWEPPQSKSEPDAGSQNLQNVIACFMKEFRIPDVSLCDKAIKRLSVKVHEHTRFFRDVVTQLAKLDGGCEVNVDPATLRPAEVLGRIQRLQKRLGETEAKAKDIRPLPLALDAENVIQVFRQIQVRLNLPHPPKGSLITRFYFDSYVRGEHDVSRHEMWRGSREFPEWAEGRGLLSNSSSSSSSLAESSLSSSSEGERESDQGAHLKEAWRKWSRDCVAMVDLLARLVENGNVALKDPKSKLSKTWPKRV